MTGFDRLDQALYVSGVVAWLCLIAAAPALYREACAGWRWSNLRNRWKEWSKL